MGEGSRGEGIGDSPGAIPVFAIAFPFAILAPMPTLEKNATQPGLITQDGNVLEITRRLAVMNLALRGIEADFGPEHADTFRRDLHPDLRADYVLANPPFNDSDWFRKDDDVRFFSLSASNWERAGVRCRKFCPPPRGNANFAWMQHFISAGPVDGRRRKELKDLFAGCKAGLVFVTAFENRRTMQTFVSHIAGNPRSGSPKTPTT